jgi:Kef-type K+ transport system membrane component KefB
MVRSLPINILGVSLYSITGITWAYTVAICAVAFIGKFGGCAVAARLTGFSWREAGAIGSLMSCKGSVLQRCLTIW